VIKAILYDQTGIWVDDTTCVEGSSSSSKTHDFSSYSSKLMYDQIDQTDYEFISSLMAMYGLSYCFAHPISSKYAGLSQLYLSSGYTFPHPGDTTKYNALLQTKTSDTIPALGDADPAWETWDTTGWSNYTDTPALDWAIESSNDDLSKQALSKWSIEGRIGTDRVLLDSPYPNGELRTGSAWAVGGADSTERFTHHNRFFHAYRRDAATTDVDADVAKILAAEQCAEACAQTVWSGKTANMLVCPGERVTVSNGGPDASGTPLTVRVTAIELVAQENWNSNYGMIVDGDFIDPETLDDYGYVEVNFTAQKVAADAETNRYCVDPMTLEAKGNAL
jgi:hypothetical protein